MKIQLPFINSIYASFQSNVQKHLNSPQKRIMALVVVILGALTTCFYLYRWCSKEKLKVVKQEKLPHEKQLPLPLPLEAPQVHASPNEEKKNEESVQKDLEEKESEPEQKKKVNQSRKKN